MYIEITSDDMEVQCGKSILKCVHHFTEHAKENFTRMTFLTTWDWLA